MNRSQIEQVIVQFIKETFLFDGKAELGLQESLIGSGIVDSTGTLELIVFLEKEFKIAFEDRELVIDNFESVERIASFVVWKLGSKRNTPQPQTQAVAGGEKSNVVREK